MAKYKDADELLKRLNSCKYPAEKQTMRQATYNAAISDACRCVDALPAADVVEVVRCKDCKHSRQHDDEFWIAEAPLLCELFDIYVGDDDYCSWGERKDG